VWTVSNSQIYENGRLLPTTSDVILLFFLNGQIYQQNSSCGVWYASGSTWIQTPFPQGYAAPEVGGIWNATPYTGLTALMLSAGTGQFVSDITGGSCVGPFASSLGLYASTSNLVIGSSTPAGITPLDVSASGLIEENSCGTNSGQISLSGSLDPANVLSLTSISGSAGTLSTVGWQFNDLYNLPSALSTIAGTWSDWSVNSSGETSIDSSLSAYLEGLVTTFPTGEGTLTIDDSGVMSEDDTFVNGEGLTQGCTTTGQVSIVNQFYNMYSFTASIQCYNGLPTAAFAPTTESGVMYVDTTVTPNKIVGGGTMANLEAGSINNEMFSAERQ
jgi:hypothetical protein